MAKARENATEARLERLLYRHQAEPCTNPIEALQRLIGRALAMEAAIGEMVNDLTAIRHEDDHGGEQLRAEVAVLERALDRCGRLLVEIAKLNIEERLAKVTEAQAAQLNVALRGIFGRLALSAEQSALLPVVVPEELLRASITPSMN